MHGVLVLASSLCVFLLVRSIRDGEDAVALIPQKPILTNITSEVPPQDSWRFALLERGDSGAKDDWQENSLMMFLACLSPCGFGFDVQRSLCLARHILQGKKPKDSLIECIETPEDSANQSFFPVPTPSDIKTCVADPVGDTKRKVKDGVEKHYSEQNTNLGEDDKKIAQRVMVDRLQGWIQNSIDGIKQVEANQDGNPISLVKGMFDHFKDQAQMQDLYKVLEMYEVTRDMYGELCYDLEYKLKIVAQCEKWKVEMARLVEVEGQAKAEEIKNVSVATACGSIESKQSEPSKSLDQAHTVGSHTPSSLEPRIGIGVSVRVKS